MEEQSGLSEVEGLAAEPEAAEAAEAAAQKKVVVVEDDDGLAGPSRLSQNKPGVMMSLFRGRGNPKGQTPDIHVHRLVKKKCVCVSDLSFKLHFKCYSPTFL